MNIWNPLAFCLKINQMINRLTPESIDQSYYQWQQLLEAVNQAADISRYKKIDPAIDMLI